MRRVFKVDMPEQIVVPSVTMDEHREDSYVTMTPSPISASH